MKSSVSPIYPFQFQASQPKENVNSMQFKVLNIALDVLKIEIKTVSYLILTSFKNYLKFHPGDVWTVCLLQ